MRWGLVPHWSNPKTPYRTFNAPRRDPGDWVCVALFGDAVGTVAPSRSIELDPGSMALEVDPFEPGAGVVGYTVTVPDPLTMPVRVTSSV